MKCKGCGDDLSGGMNFCLSCGMRRNTAVRPPHFRDLSIAGGSPPCRECRVPMRVIEVETSPPMRVERCGTCSGIFFNPGELETVLLQRAEDQGRFEALLAGEAARLPGPTERKVFYRKCPLCEERMSHLNFGNRSGVILDRCGKHGLWLDGGQLRRLAEWWAKDGRKQKVGNLLVHRNPLEASVMGSIQPAASGQDGIPLDDWWGWGEVFSAVAEFAFSLGLGD